MSKELNGYPGSKAAAGLAERIIREMPPHTYYVEGFAGHAAVYRLKKKAQVSVLVDIDPQVIKDLKLGLPNEGKKPLVYQSDFIAFYLRNENFFNQNTVLYLDPPYLFGVRTGAIYDHEFGTVVEHLALIEIFKKTKANCLLSGYWSDLYERELKGYRCVEIPAMTRGGIRNEYLWMNFEQPEFLHDSRFAGWDYRERERIKKKAKRWTFNFMTMPTAERQAIIEEIQKVDKGTLETIVKELSPAIEVDQADTLFHIDEAGIITPGSGKRSTTGS